MSQYISFDSPVPPVPSTGEGDFCVSFDRKWLGYMVGALQVLLDRSTYESEQDRAISEAANLILAIQTGVCEVGVRVGSIMQYATATVPDGCLECDGSSYLRVDYPALYAVLDASYKSDADHFVTPDFRGRAPIGKGTGSGLSARSMNQAVGVESVALSIAEMPAHTHDVSTNNAGTGGTNGVTGTLNTSNTQTASAKALTRGSGSSHTNMQPSRVTGFCIVAVP